VTRPNEQQAAAQAPDASSLKAANRLAVRAPWDEIGHNERAVWGHCRGSGKTPYAVAVDLAGPAFRCSCPSRKFPCKHALGLLLLWARDSDAVPPGAPPAEVASWLAGRSAAGKASGSARLRAGTVPSDDAQDGATKGGERPELTAEQRELSARQAAARAARRVERIAAGMQELDGWLGDLVRVGLGDIASRGAAFYDEMGARLVDAQAPAAGAAVRRLAGIARSGRGWPERYVAALGRLYLLVSAWSRYPELDAARQADLRTNAGWPTSSAEVLATGPRSQDRWHVLGRSETEEDRVTALRTWLWGERSGTLALVLDFVRPGALAAWELWPGNAVEATVVHFPGVAPLRVLVEERHDEASAAVAPASERLRDAARARSTRLARDPYLDRWPVSMAAVTPVGRPGGWAMLDAEGDSLPLDCDDATGWKLMAGAAGQPIALTAEWRTGGGLLPLTLRADGELVIL
jgi:hypothetical protein